MDLETDDSPARFRQRVSRRVILLMCVVAIAVIGAVAPTQDRSMLAREFLNAGHIFAYGLIAFVIVYVMDLVLPKIGGRRWPLYLIALIATLLLGVAAEILQTRVPGRSADVKDVVRDCIGAVAALFACGAFDYKLRLFGWLNRGRNRLVLLLCAAVVVLIGLTPFLTVLADYQRRTMAAPVLFDADQNWCRRFVAPTHSNVEYVATPAEWQRDVQKQMLRFETKPHYEWCGVSFHDPYPDWSEFNTVNLDIVNPNGEDREMKFRVHDIHHNWYYVDRFKQKFVLKPGRQTISFSVDDVLNGPKSTDYRPNGLMDIKNISHMSIYVSKPEKVLSFYVVSFWLE